MLLGELTLEMRQAERKTHHVMPHATNDTRAALALAAERKIIVEKKVAMARAKSAVMEAWSMVEDAKLSFGW
jgi:hypothetical protein